MFTYLSQTFLVGHHYTSFLVIFPWRHSNLPHMKKTGGFGPFRATAASTRMDCNSNFSVQKIYSEKYQQKCSTSDFCSVYKSSPQMNLFYHCLLMKTETYQAILQDAEQDSSIICWACVISLENVPYSSTSFGRKAHLQRIEGGILSKFKTPTFILLDVHYSIPNTVTGDLGIQPVELIQ